MTDNVSGRKSSGPGFILISCSESKLMVWISAIYAIKVSIKSLKFV